MRLARLNPGFVSLAAVASLSKGVHDGKLLLLNLLTGHTITLPPSVGSGCTLKFVETVAPTSNSNIIKVANATDVLIGNLGISIAAGGGSTFPTGATSDTVTMNRTTTGGVSNGEWLEFVDTLAGFWSVAGVLNGSGVLATPFSATV